MPQSTPRQLGKYKILEEIGQGGFGDVYLAEDTMLGSTVALKILAPVYVRDPTVVRRFQQEARAAARLRHPNIVRIYDLGEDEGVLFLAMDYLPDRSLAEMIREEGPLPLERVARLLTQVASALDYAHQQGLIHRDVKPANVMVDGVGHATLMDFGLVKAADHTQFTVLYRTADSEQFTTGGGTIGTPEYMAPEQADPALGQVGPHTDLYALGVMAYQMLAGRVPFQASTPVATLRAHADLPPPPLSEWSQVPDRVAEVVLKALAKSPDERWESAGAFAGALAEAVSRAQTGKAQEAQLAALYAQAEEALAEKQWARALGLCGQIMTQSPTYRQVEELFAQANEGLARQKAWESQQAELTALYDQAIAHSTAEDWDQAIVLLTQIAQTSEDHTFRDAPQKLAEALAAKEQAEAERQARVEALREETLRAGRHLFDLLDEWWELEPDRAELEAARGLVTDLLNQWAAPVEPEPVKEIQPQVAPDATPAIGEGESAVQRSFAGEQRRQWKRQPFEPEMVYVPAGSFLMGSAEDDPSASPNEQPEHKVYLEAFWIGRYPVTNAQFKAFVDDAGYPPPTHWLEDALKQQITLPASEQDHPVVHITWDDAIAYCRWLSQETGRAYRLPTEAEWEKAARGPDGRFYPWGDDPPTEMKCNCGGNIGHTTPVGRYTPIGDSPYGCADMVGNVWEWTSSLYKPYPYDPHDGREDSNRIGSRTLRGGSWKSGWEWARPMYRNKILPTSLDFSYGFRCCASSVST